MVCMSWVTSTFLQVKPSGELLVGFQAVCAICRTGGGGLERRIGGPFGDNFRHFLMYVLFLLFVCLCRD